MILFVGLLPFGRGYLLIWPCFQSISIDGSLAPTSICIPKANNICHKNQQKKNLHILKFLDVKIYHLKETKKWKFKTDNKKTWQHTINRNLKELKSSTSNIFNLIFTMLGLSVKVRDEHAPNCVLKSRPKEKQTANDEIYDLTVVKQ